MIFTEGSSHFFGKIIGGGLPIGAFGGRRDIMAQYDPTAAGGARIAHAGTFNANPMTLVAGEAVMRALTPPIYRRLAALGGVTRLSELDVPEADLPELAEAAAGRPGNQANPRPATPAEIEALLRSVY